MGTFLPPRNWAYTDSQGSSRCRRKQSGKNLALEDQNLSKKKLFLSYDKDDIVEISKKINTYDISIRPYEDCCTVFVPKHPTIKPIIDDVLSEEQKCDFEAEIEAAIDSIKEYDLSMDSKINVFEDENDDDIFKI